MTTRRQYNSWKQCGMGAQITLIDNSAVTAASARRNGAAHARQPRVIAKREDDRSASRGMLESKASAQRCTTSHSSQCCPAAKVDAVPPTMFSPAQPERIERTAHAMARTNAVACADSEKVRPRHQEEFCQACAWPAGLKYESGLKNEPRWEQAYTILARHSRDPAVIASTAHAHPGSELGNRTHRSAPTEPWVLTRTAEHTFRGDASHQCTTSRAVSE